MIDFDIERFAHTRVYTSEDIYLVVCGLEKGYIPVRIEYHTMQNTIEVLTIVKTSDEAGQVNYSVNGSLSLDEAARALVIVAFQAEKPKKEGSILIGVNDDG